MPLIANAANILWLDELTFNGSNATLFMRHWNEFEDILLVRKAGFDLALLKNITFEGYERFQTTWRDYNRDFIEIIPGGIPEPTTYGAIFGVLGVGAYLIHRRRGPSAQRPGLRPRRCGQ